MKGGCGSRIGTGMTDSRHRRQIVYQTVVKRVALVYQTAESILTNLVVLARQVVPTHLVYYNAYHQLGLFTKLWALLCRCSQHAAYSHKEK